MVSWMKKVMQQPPGFTDPEHPSHVCRLHKTIYGLRQAPRTWFHRLSSFLLQSDFTRSSADTSMFILNSTGGMIILLLYVDDIILTGDNSCSLSSFVKSLNAQFALEHLGCLSYFLGIGAN